MCSLSASPILQPIALPITQLRLCSPALPRVRSLRRNHCRDSNLVYHHVAGVCGTPPRRMILQSYCRSLLQSMCDLLYQGYRFVRGFLVFLAAERSGPLGISANRLPCFLNTTTITKPWSSSLSAEHLRFSFFCCSRCGTASPCQAFK